MSASTSLSQTSVEDGPIGLLCGALVRVAGKSCLPSLSLVDFDAFKIHGEEAYLENDNFYHEGMKALQHLKESIHLAELVNSFLNVRLATLQERIKPASFHRGIMNLPNELLVHIFQLSSEQVRLSQVCHRFRSIVMLVPSLWASVHEGLHTADLERHLALSKNTPLCISLSASHEEAYGSHPWRRFLSATLPHAHRWRDLWIDLGGTLEDTEDLLSCPNANFPALEHLRIEYPEELDGYAECVHAWWAFPSVKTLRVERGVPPPGVFAALVVCTLCNPHPLDVLDLQLLVAFLDAESAPALRELTICIGSVCEVVPSRDSASLPSLTTLNISNITSCGASTIPYSAVICRIFRILDMPKVESISIGHASAGFQKVDVGHCLRSPFPDLCEVKNLSFSGISHPCDLPALLLEHFELCTSDHTFLKSVTETHCRVPSVAETVRRGPS